MQIPSSGICLEISVNHDTHMPASHPKRYQPATMIRHAGPETGSPPLCKAFCPLVTASVVNKIVLADTLDLTH